MSTAGIAALLDRLGSDEELRSRLEEAATPQAKRRIVTAAGFDVERGDLDTLRSLVGLAELSDEDLERVAGGGSTATNIGATVASTVVAGGAAAAVAAVA